jgi:hypothetical protein
MVVISFEKFVTDSLGFYQEVKREIEATAPISDGKYHYKRGGFVYHALDEVIAGLEALSNESSPVSVEQLPNNAFNGALPFADYARHSGRYLNEVMGTIENSGQEWNQLEKTKAAIAELKQMAIHEGPKSYLDEEMAKAAYLIERPNNPTAFMLAAYVGNDLEVAYRSEANAINKILHIGVELSDLSVDM